MEESQFEYKSLNCKINCTLDICSNVMMYLKMYNIFDDIYNYIYIFREQKCESWLFFRTKLQIIELLWDNLLYVACTNILRSFIIDFHKINNNLEVRCHLQITITYEAGYINQATKLTEICYVIAITFSTILSCLYNMISTNS